jgi:holliday junction DNA helicase RuvA
MIGWMQGRIVDRPEAGKLVIETQGVGYDVETSLNTFFQLETQRDPITLHIHTVVREDAFLLYGFIDKQERSLFRSLIKVNGVGPKLAMNILSSISPQEFFECVQANDANRLVRLPGVGKKTAERLLIEMKDRLKDLCFASPHSTPMKGSAQSEATSALEALGYKNHEAVKMIKAVDNSSLSCEQLIREALKRVS